MKKVLVRLSLLLTLGSLFSSCYNIRINEVEKWEPIFEKHGLEGAFELYDNNKETTNYHNLELCSERVAPAQTFFVVTSLIALETATVNDENKPIRWLKDYPSQSYTDSLSLREAFKQGNNAFFTTLHDRINKDYYLQYFDSMAYGNMEYDTGDIWNTGKVQISLDEQVGLMKRLYHNEVKFVSERTTTIVRSMLLNVDQPDVKFYSLASPVKIKNEEYYWIIGMIETYNPLKNPKTDRIENKVHPYFFGLLVKSKSGSITENQATGLLHDLLESFGIPYE